MWQKQQFPSLEDFVSLQTLTKCGLKCAPHRRTLSCSGLQPNVAQNVPLVGGLCHAVNFDQMWPKMCPSLEDFVTQWTSTKCCPKCAPHWRTLSCSGLWPNVSQNVPLIRGLCHTADFDQLWPKMCPSSEDFVTQRTLTKCGLKCAPRRRTLSCSRLQPNVAQNVPLARGLCHAADFDQLWPKMCPLLEDFVTQQTSTKCGPNMCPLMGDFVLLWGSTTYGSTTYSSLKKGQYQADGF